MTRASAINEPAPVDLGIHDVPALPPADEIDLGEVLNEGRPIVPAGLTTAGRLASAEADLKNRGEQYLAQQNILNAVMDTLDRICDDLDLDRTDWAKAARGERE